MFNDLARAGGSRTGTPAKKIVRAIAYFELDAAVSDDDALAEVVDHLASFGAGAPRFSHARVVDAIEIDDAPPAAGVTAPAQG